MKPYFEDKIIKFKRDTAFRKQFFVPDSFAHPAKMDAQLLIWLVEHYTKEGETILDPMAGSGTTMLACMLGRSVILVELEEKFCKMCRDNWNKVKMHPQLGYEMGNCQIIQGDARALDSILLVDKIITSPPYAEANQRQDVDFLKRIAKDQSRKYKTGENKGHFASAEAIERYYDKQSSELNEGNLANLPYGNIDSIITSPPYEAQGFKCDENPANVIRREEERRKLFPCRPKTFVGRYSGDYNNIGNLKSDSYLSAMLQVYQQCYKVLKSGGLMILITKNFIRQKAIVRLDEDTIKLCEQAGFKFIERHYRELPAQSFWRIIYKQKYPDAPEIKYEDVLVFNRGVPNP